MKSGIDAGVMRKMKIRKDRIIKIKDAIVKSKKRKKELSYPRLILAVMSAELISKRPAQELVDVALFELNLSKEDLLK